jgi:hypothetical protein
MTNHCYRTATNSQAAMRKKKNGSSRDTTPTQTTSALKPLVCMHNSTQRFQTTQHIENGIFANQAITA